MRRHSAAVQYAVLGTLTLFIVLALFMSLEGGPAGRATTGTTANISATIPANCTFLLGQGYNLISLPCISTIEPVTNVTAGTPVRAMYQYVPGDSDPWRVYNPDLPEYVVSDLQYMTRRAGYVVIANDSVNKTIEGRRAGFTDVPIVRGWGLVGYPRFNESNISDALASVNGSFSMVLGYDKPNESFLLYTNPGGNLTVLTPGQGYWINGTSPANWGMNP